LRHGAGDARVASSMREVSAASSWSRRGARVAGAVAQAATAPAPSRMEARVEAVRARLMRLMQLGLAS
jgi:hypothetical protein